MRASRRRDLNVKGPQRAETAPITPGTAAGEASSPSEAIFIGAKLIDKKPFNLVAVALANKMARIAFAIMRGKTVYRKFRRKERG